VRLATPAEVQTWSDSRVAEERDGTIEPAADDEWAGVSRARAVTLTATAKQQC